MIVEDEALLALDLEQILVNAGVDVAGIAATKTEAMALAGRESPHLALLDVHLLDGVTGPSIARELAVCGVTKVIFMTANEAMLGAAADEAIGVISKPYTARGLVTAISYVTDGILRPPPVGPPPPCLKLSPSYVRLWAANGLSA